MDLEKIVEKIPSPSWDSTSERLIDIVLNSSNAKKMPSGLAKTILYYWQRDQLATKIGLERLLEASMIVDSEKTIEILKELGFQELVTVLESR
jgi:adenylate cyclase class IV